MQIKPARKKSTLFVKCVSGEIINKSHAPIEGHVVAGAPKDRSLSKCPAILVVETKNERKRTIKEYEKQRDVLRSVITR